MNIGAIRDAINLFLANPAWDILLLIFFFAAIFIYGLAIGRNKIIVLLLASYPAALINEYLLKIGNFLDRFNDYQILFFQAFSFFVFTLFIFWILNKSGFTRKEIAKKTGQVLFFSFLSVGFWANILFGYAGAINSEILKLAPLTRLLFGSPLAHFVWLVLPIAFLFYFEKD